MMEAARQKLLFVYYQEGGLWLFLGWGETEDVHADQKRFRLVETLDPPSRDRDTVCHIIMFTVLWNIVQFGAVCSVIGGATEC